MGNFYAGIDLGGTKILTAIADENGEILASKRVATQEKKGEAKIIENIYQSLQQTLAETGLNFADLQSIGVGSPGPLNTSEGVIYDTPNLPFANFPLKDMLQDKVELPVFLENDANAAALGEKIFGAGQNCSDQIYITVSTGIGGGIIIGDKIFHGTGDGAGEIGHMIINPAGPTCGFEQHRGCLEAMASGTAIAREARRLLQNGRAPQLLKLLENKDINYKQDEIPGSLIARAAREGEKTLTSVYREMGYYLGLGVASLITLFNPELIIFGGGVMKARDLFWLEMKNTAADNALPSSWQDCQLVEAELEDRTGVMGAIAVALHEDQEAK